MLPLVFKELWALLLLFSVVCASDITTFRDGKCTRSFSNLDTVNGYPDGVCTQLNLGGTIQSFQIAGLDPGCAVTLYGPNSNELSCSSETKIVGQLATCYNTSWVYYSIDGCLPPSSSSTVRLPASSPTIFSIPASTGAATREDSNITGVIIGGVVGGVCGLALIFIVALLILRQRRKRLQKPLPATPSYELSNDHALLESACSEKFPPVELGRGSFHTEIGPRSYTPPPVELPANVMYEDDKKGINPLIRLHMVR